MTRDSLPLWRGSHLLMALISGARAINTATYATVDQPRIERHDITASSAKYGKRVFQAFVHASGPVVHASKPHQGVANVISHVHEGQSSPRPMDLAIRRARALSRNFEPPAHCSVAS